VPMESPVGAGEWQTDMEAQGDIASPGTDKLNECRENL